VLVNSPNDWQQLPNDTVLSSCISRKTNKTPSYWSKWLL